MEMCMECKTEVVYYYRSFLCEDCIKDFFEGKRMIKVGIKLLNADATMRERK